MLSLGKIGAGPQAARYYTDQVALGTEEYYDGEGEAPGRWLGAAAAAASLEGEVEAGEFEQLLAGGGLRRPVRDAAVAGFDLTFRAPKSVSVLWGVADLEVTRELGEAHDAAVANALGYLERDACWARRGAGGMVQVRGAGFVAAAFRHRASRAGDPLLHTHVVAGNLTLGPDGRWTALDARHLYRHAKTAGYLYHAELRRELTQRLGLAWGPVERGTADLQGVPREVIDHFSQRRAEILEHMAEHGGRSAASAQVAALATRRVKPEIGGDRLREQWRARAAEHGLTTHNVERALTLHDYTVPFAAAIAPEALTYDASVFGRPELLQALAEAQPRGASIDELERLADVLLADRAIVALPHGPAPAGLTERRFTTTEMLATEQDLLDYAIRSTNTDSGRVSPGAVMSAFPGRTLSEEQRGVVVDLCLQGDGVAALRAPAGTGKTFVLDAARAAWQAEGVEVIGCALSARAALELNDQAAIPSLTLAALTARLADGSELPRHGVLVVDEAGMVGTRDLARLAVAAEQSDTKLVLVGDDRQLPEIHAGGAFRTLAERLPASELHEVRRQDQAWDRQALGALRSGEVEQWARAYREHGQITVADSTAATRSALVNDWSRADGDRLMIAARRDDVADLNHRARHLLQHRGDLGPDELTVAGRAFTTGDRVIGTRNDRHAGILNGQRGTVAATHPDQRTVSLRLDNATTLSIGPDYLEAGHLDHAYAITAHRAQGATVDHTFVLGSEEMYREWAYTALSRHRQQARFYLTGADLRLDHDLPPPHDPLITAISQLMDRSHAKELAIDSLPHADREQLELERRQLRQQLTGQPPPDRHPDVENHDLDASVEALNHARKREHTLRGQREQLRWRDRGPRAHLDSQLEHNLTEQHRRELRLRNAFATRDAADAHDGAWLHAHGPRASRLLAIDSELHSRDTAADRAAQRVQNLDRDPLELTREPPMQSRDLDGFDLGL